MPNNEDLPTISLLRNGIELSDVSLNSATIEFGFSTLPKAVLVISVGNNTEFIQESEKEQWQPGESLDIKLGYNKEEDLVFSGIIVNHKVTISKDNNSKMELELGHRYYLMSIKKNSRIFTDVKDSDAIEQILNDYDLTTEIDTTAEIHRQFTQFNTTDWNFINFRAKASNRFVLPKNETFIVKNISADAPEKLDLSFGTNILGFGLETDCRSSFETFKTKTWNFDNQEIITEESSESFASSAGLLRSTEIAAKCHHGSAENLALGSFSDVAASEIATRNALNAELSKIRGSIQTLGNTRAEIGDWIKVNGVGKQFSGQLLITGIKHEIADGKYLTTYQIGTDPENFINEDSISEKNNAFRSDPQMTGLQIGVVVSLESPQSDDKILVQLPHLNSSEGAVWARHSRMEAGKNRGWIFRPEIGDEVVVAFINDDLQQAVILGAMNSDSRIAPLYANDENNLKGYVSRENLKLLFDEDKKIISILTPTGSIELNEDAQKITLKNKGNTLELSPDGISFETEKNLKIKAKGDIEIEGMNLHLKSKSQLKVEGTAGVDIVSSAVTSVKGALVQIN